MRMKKESLQINDRQVGEVDRRVRGFEPVMFNSKYHDVNSLINALQWTSGAVSCSAGARRIGAKQPG